MRNSVFQATGILAVALAAASPARAANLYTFDGPQFSAGEATPIGPTAPNVGDPTFTTAFAASGDPGGADIAPGGFPSSLFSGALLVTEGVGGGGPLTLTFNKPVSRLSVDFGLDAPSDDLSAFFELVTASGTVDQLSTDAGAGPFAGGVLTFTSGTPFSTATLQAFSGPGAPTLFAIDNLVLTTAVPEPSSLALLGGGLAGFMALVLFQRKKAVV